MSVNKYQNGELIKVSGNANASEIYFKDDVSELGVSNVKAAIDKLNTKKIDTENILNSLAAVTASTNSNNVAGALAVKELNNNVVAIENNKVNNIYIGSDNRIHVVKGGADSVLPFSKTLTIPHMVQQGVSSNARMGCWFHIDNIGWKTLTLEYRASSHYGYDYESYVRGYTATEDVKIYSNPKTTQGPRVSLDISRYGYLIFFVDAYGEGVEAGFYNLVFS